VKPVVWLGDALERLRGFPAGVRQQAGYQLERVQAGKEPSDWKPMPSVGLGVCELRIRAQGAFRVMYMTRFAEAVYVLHAFQKKSRTAPRADIDLARKRFADLTAERSKR
jgi:phage-related protein